MNYLTQLGVGGIFAILVIREVLSFLKAKRVNNSSGVKSPEYWTLEIGRIVKENLEPILKNQEKILANHERIMEHLFRREG